MAAVRVPSRDRSRMAMICDETGPLSLHRQAPIPEAEPAQAFDDLTLLASRICGTPIALMTLVDENPVLGRGVRRY